MVGCRSNASAGPATQEPHITNLDLMKMYFTYEDRKKVKKEQRAVLLINRDTHAQIVPE